ncbi:MAG: VCBS repeat-containing protein [Bacteroidetes bacterium]|nr:VCBS repeat-containing protein [Bacteroidota bacterium]
MRADKLLKVFCFALLISGGCSTGDQDSAYGIDTDHLFTLLPEKRTGISFVNEIVQTAQFNILFYEYYFNGGGVAIGDVNNDDLPDIYFTGNLVPNRLYLNLGDLRFEDVTEKAGVDGWVQAVPYSWSTGVTMVDINNDGLLDIYVCKSGPFESIEARENLLFINNGDETFTEKGKEYGLNDNGYSTQATFFDYDKDGDLDLYVLNHPDYFSRLDINQASEAVKNIQELARISGNLYRNNGDESFSKVTEEAGLLKYGYGLGVVAADLNNDGWTDLYVSNDFSTPDCMFINNKNGTFSDVVKTSTSHISFYGMGCDVADINNDGYVDIYVLDMTAEDHYRSKTLMASMNPLLLEHFVNVFDYQYQYMFNTLQLNNGNGSFSEIGQLTGLHKTDWSWTPLFADFDNDGLKDLFITNGIKQDVKNKDLMMELENAQKTGQRVGPGDIMQWLEKMPSEKLANYMFRNKGDLQFEKIASDWGLDEPTFSNGAAYADLDLDGDLDLVINNVDDVAFIYRNNTNEHSENNYLLIKLNGDEKDLLGLNTKVTVYTQGLKQFQELTLTKGFQSSCENILHFGLGVSTSIDSVIVIWMDGKKQVLKEVDINTTLILNKDNATKALKAIEMNEAIFTKVPGGNGLIFRHRENPFNDFDKEKLLPHKQSIYGPPIGVGDVNMDGLDDVFIGGAKGQSGSLFFQQSGGQFTKQPDDTWAQDEDCEDTGVAIFDCDNDGDNDIYVVSGGGGEFEIQSEQLKDRLYINNGSGVFTKSSALQEDIRESSLAITTIDYDKDGDLDLFVGGRVVPGRYPQTPNSYLLQNNDGKFTDVTKTAALPLSQMGMVTYALATDFDSDGWTDLIITGEWMPLSFFRNVNGQFQDVTKDLGFENTEGWWNCIIEGDFDNDGDPDYIAGNWGLNSKFKATTTEPLLLFAGDLDENGTFDIVLAENHGGVTYPVRGRQCSSDQIPGIIEKFPTYHEFAISDVYSIYGQETLSNSLTLQARDFRSCFIRNNGSLSFSIEPLPRAAQKAPIRSMVTADINEDGNLDLLAVGNMYGTEAETARYDAGIGWYFEGDGKGSFRSVSVNESGFYVRGDSRNIISLSTSDEKVLFIVSINDGELIVFEQNKQSSTLVAK